MRTAVIDIGTNTVLLLVAEKGFDGQIETLAYEQRVPRLGRGVDGSGFLQEGSIRRVIGVLEEYLAMIRPFSVDSIVTIGTSAVRDARNQREFLAEVHARTGLSVEVLSGEEEAFWTFRGAISGLPDLVKATVVDIGGGSTEITTGTPERISARVSLDIGSVRLTERCFRHDPPTHLELEQAIEIVEDALAKAAHLEFRNSTLVGVAGTATSLAIVDQGLAEFSRKAATGYVLKRDNVYALFRRLRAMPASAILNLSAVMEGRADVITAGALILREIMAHFKFESMIVSERGVRYGILLREWKHREMKHQESTSS